MKHERIQVAEGETKFKCEYVGCRHKEASAEVEVFGQKRCKYCAELHSGSVGFSKSNSSQYRGELQ